MPAGNCQTQIVTADAAGPWPAVILGFDAGGQRSAVSEIAMRIAKLGDLVALPDRYHRVGSIFDILPPGAPRDTSGMLSAFDDQNGARGVSRRGLLGRARAKLV
jgi:dienelactone hydrolase